MTLLIGKKGMKKEKMDDYEECKKCLKSDHVGIFCRCESRNMRIAKEHRMRKESAWDKIRKESKDERK